ncbi:hypothetical protein AVEN_184254-1 [Araneus ventricosus]|uniref:Uncharacterized protein n=1 Tax=Araneus ventricosus TaxID=182803 RepID=A0A4Y2GL20_ARAVE|nr:hypothetical protein AVEN_184254-1 [Araneus ventricosus]
MPASGTKGLKKSLTLQHAPVGAICDSENVWRHFMSFLAFVQLDHFLRVDGKLLVGIDYDAEEAGVCLGGENKLEQWIEEN